MTNSFIVAGTGTDVGKTFVTAVILDTLKRMGKTNTVCKPIQTGTEFAPTDPDTLGHLLPELTRLSPEKEILYSFCFPASPDFAGRLEGRRIAACELTKTLQQTADESGVETFIAELAGGIAVPLNESETNLDLMSALNWPVILVTDAHLGMINHTLLSLWALRSRNIKIAGLIVNRYQEDLLCADNVRTVSAMGKVPILALIPQSDTLPILEDSPLHALFR